VGSYIAQGVAFKAPERVEKLILVCSKSNGETSSMARLFKQNESELKGLIISRSVKMDRLKKSEETFK
jgi:3-oxoadipate enol-lactonase